MAASDPTPYVATPTGTLQGVAAFSWDGSAWQPSGRAGPDVATPTGVLQGVAPFAWDGSAWQPSGRAQPGVATPTGVLDGVAVYTWSGSAWTPASGTVTPSTPSGALRGVAAFSWDGGAWQPAAQARASVPTPYGVLNGVAMFEWGGSSWQAGAAVPAGATLDLSFLSGALDPRITFTRASTATYFDSSGVMQTAAMNLWIQSSDASLWNLGQITSGNPVVIANQGTAPNGTLTAASVAFPAVSGAGNASLMYQSITTTAAQYTFSVYMRGSVGGEQLYLSTNVANTTFSSSSRITLTTAWQRFTLTPAALTAASWTFVIGTDLRAGGQASTAAQTVYVWGAQVELGTAATSYVPTTASASGAPRFDYDPVTHAARGLLIEEARTNLLLYSGDASNVTWAKSGTGPVVTGNSTTAPDGTMTASLATYGAVTAGTFGLLNQPIVVTANVYTFSVYLRGFAGGEQIYLCISGTAFYSSSRITLTTQWQRYTFTTPTLAVGTQYFAVGCDLRDVTQSPIPAQNLYVWGAQVELGAFPTSYIPTTAAAVTRAMDVATIPPTGWFVSPGGSWQAEFVSINPLVAASFRRIVTIDVAASVGMITLDNTASLLGQWDGAAALFTANAVTVGAVAKGATTWTVGTAKSCLNGGAVATSAALTGGYAGVLANNVRFLSNATPAEGMSGYIRRLRYWPRVLSNAELQSVTT